MLVDYHPRRFLAERLAEGWQLIPDHSYNPGDYAIVMQLPEQVAISTARQVRQMMIPFIAKPRRPNNKSNGAESASRVRLQGFFATWSKKREEA